MPSTERTQRFCSEFDAVVVPFETEVEAFFPPSVGANSPLPLHPAKAVTSETAASVRRIILRWFDYLWVRVPMPDGIAPTSISLMTLLVAVSITSTVPFMSWCIAPPDIDDISAC